MGKRVDVGGRPIVKKKESIDTSTSLDSIPPGIHNVLNHVFQGYFTIYNNSFKSPWMPDRTEAHPNELNQDDARYGFRCCNSKNISTASLTPEDELSRQMPTSTTSIDIMGLQDAYANFHIFKQKASYEITR